MIKLTGIADQPIYIASDKIIAVYATEDGAHVDTGEDSAYPVKESPEEVVQKMLEYNLAMTRYSTAYAEALKKHGDPQWIFENAELKMSELAGLEE